jgi:DNA-binding HxlR family transcriptional regulator
MFTMKSLTPVNQQCGIARSLDVLGEKWTLLVVRDVRLGFTRFGDIKDRLGVAPDVLADRLGKLVNLGVLERRSYRDDGARSREEYVLTPAGEELAPVLASLQAWGDRHLPNGMVPASRYVEAASGEPVRIAFVDTEGRELGLDRVRVERTAATAA